MYIKPLYTNVFETSKMFHPELRHSLSPKMETEGHYNLASSTNTPDSFNKL